METALQKQLRYCAEQAKKYKDGSINDEGLRKSFDGMDLLGILFSKANEMKGCLDIFYSGEKESAFALRMINHDILNLFSVCHNYFSRKNPERYSYYRSSMEEYVAFTEAIGFLATGDKTLLSDFSVKDIPELFYNFEDIEVRCKDEEKIDAGTLTAVYQIMKNSFRGNKKIVEVGEEKKFKIYSVSDFWKGIDAEILPKLFDGYSSREGGGYGIQCVKKIAEMHDGYVEVLTKYESQPGYYFSTKTKELKEIEKKETGTIFRLNIKK